MTHVFKYFTTVKFALALLVCAFSFNTGSSQSSVSESNVGVLTFESEIIDYGQVQENSDGERTFLFTN